MSNLKAKLCKLLDGDDMDCVRDRTGKSDDYCEGFVDGMSTSLINQARSAAVLAEQVITELKAEGAQQ